MSELEQNNSNVSNISLWEELEVPYLAGLPRSNFFVVPKDYFNDLPERIEKCVFLTELKVASEIHFTVPAEYFENLSAQIEGKLAAEHLKSLVSGTGLSTPANYFEHLNKTILNKKTVLDEKPNVVHLWQNRLFKYVSAACVIVSIASGLYYNSYIEAQLPVAADLISENMLYDIDETAIRAHLQETDAAAGTSASITELEQYILINFSSSDISSNL